MKKTALTLIAGVLLAQSHHLCAHDGEEDRRVAVILPADDHEHLLEDMREFLERAAGMLEALAGDDLARVKQIADSTRPPLPRARALAEGTPLPVGPQDIAAGVRPRSERDRTRFGRMQKNLPQEFRTLMFAMRQGIADIARDVDAVKDPKHSLRQLAQVHQVCVACHRGYKLVSGDPGPWGVR